MFKKFKGHYSKRKTHKTDRDVMSYEDMPLDDYEQEKTEMSPQAVKKIVLGACIAIAAGLILVTGVFAFKAFKERHDTKFRELSIISILTLVAVVLIAISNFQSNQSNDNQFRASLHFIEIVSKNLDVEKEDVYVNTSTTTDGAILKVGNKYYRAISGSEPDSYLLEQIKLYKSDVELVEVKK